MCGKIRFSKKFQEKIMKTEGIADLIDAKLHRSRIILYTAWSGLLPTDIRNVFKQTKDEDKELINYYKKYVEGLVNWDDMAVELAEAVNQRLRYEGDDNNWGKPEYWASPINIHRRGIDDCDGYAVLTVYLWGLFGIPAYRRFVRAGNVKEGGHATAIYLSLKNNEIYPIEGSYYASESIRNFNKIPLYLNTRYGNTWWITNEEKSYSGNWFFKFIKGLEE